MDKILNYLISPMFIEGALNTLKVTLCSQTLAILLGFFIALAKRSRVKPLVWLVSGYVWIFRGIPVMVQLIFAFNVLPQWGIRLSGFQTAILALTLNESAYMSEIIRSGLASVSRGQQRAGHVLGMSRFQIMRHITLPQALRVIVPPTGNQFIGMLKTSAMASVIGFGDLLRRASQSAAANFDYVSALAAASIYYLAFSAIFTAILGLIERSMDITRKEKTAAKPVTVLSQESQA
ncbi:amino acid ABC transporter permease [Qiania dongpingensis]|uniref:Amino acid ABC transporter permease n=1 Tax=Qiania dongpingensis TaxID=2763669 RepID=A0A7G9G5B7_9FIRM|nr:amino acid ABC transporter permease [Qiania dongpingensis]QNM05999.1 amino acid ABC transporter permease [Qiania dongpingensis]